jgi:aspartyl-tRNA(Asn)/glutamyl-tRNA(Gln) amidotransferase subunit A
MRIGLLAHLFEIDLPASPEVRQAMAQAMRQLEALGAQVEEVKIAPLQEYAVVKATIQKPEIFVEYAPALVQRPEEFGAKFRARIAPAPTISAVNYVEAQRTRQRLTAELSGLFERFDLLI